MAIGSNRRAKRAASKRAIDLAAVAAAIAALVQMAVDVRKLRPSEAVRLLNSTPLGEVVTDRKLARHRNAAGLRIGAGKTIDLLRYVAWLVIERKRRAGPAALDGYEAHKERQRARQAELSLSGRDIGELPAVVDANRKVSCQRDFRRFCETYFRQTFSLAWSSDHLTVIERIEQAVLDGGLFAMAMPRGSGKTSLCETAGIWAMVYGHCPFVTLVGSDEPSAESMLDSIKIEYENNELLLEDFPEVVYPIRALEGIHQRAAGQLYQGRQTLIGWTAREIVLPTMPGSPASGAIIRVAGITGRIRGMKHKKADGTSIRPSLVIIDDPQTDQSARSPSQCKQRERVLAGAILGLAGPGRKIAGLMPCTVVRPDDMADRLLDRSKHPKWQGQRTKLVNALPTNEKLWDEYARLRREGQEDGTGNRRATAFYRKNRAAMDEGAEVAWAARKNPDELSALQHAMNLKIDDEEAFWAEYQNEPLPEETGDADALSAEQIREKISGSKRGVIPSSCSHLTMFIDVQKKALFWLVAAWEDSFSGYVVDYGTEPDQKLQYFTLREIKRTLQRAAPRAGLEGSIRAGLDRVCDALIGREWRRDDGGIARIDRCLIDANWGESTDVVYQFCRQSPHASVLIPSHGLYVGASSIPLGDRKRRRGERYGVNWRLATSATRRARYVVYDTNWWKSFVHARLAVSLGDPGCLSLFGNKPERHRLLSEHLTAEYGVRTEGRGRTVTEWKLRADGVDNHWLDGLVGAAVAASIQGASLTGMEVRPARRKRLNLAELQRSRR